MSLNNEYHQTDRAHISEKLMSSINWTHFSWNTWLTCYLNLPWNFISELVVFLIWTKVAASCPTGGSADSFIKFREILSQRAVSAWWQRESKDGIREICPSNNKRWVCPKHGDIIPGTNVGPWAEIFNALINERIKRLK